MYKVNFADSPDSPAFSRIRDAVNEIVGARIAGEEGGAHLYDLHTRLEAAVLAYKYPEDAQDIMIAAAAGMLRYAD